MSTRYFRIGPSQYQVFRFTLPRPRPVRITLSAEAPVNVLLLTGSELAEYSDGTAVTHPYGGAWGKRRELDAVAKLGPGTWYVVVEGSTEPSSGRLEIDA